MSGDQILLPSLDDSMGLLPSPDLSPAPQSQPVPNTIASSSPQPISPILDSPTCHDSPDPIPNPVISPARFKGSPYVYKRKGQPNPCAMQGPTSPKCQVWN